MTHRTGRADERTEDDPMSDACHADRCPGRIRRAIVGLASAVVALVLAAPLASSAASAGPLAISGPDTIVATGGCMPLTWYDISGGDGKGNRFYRVDSIAGNLYFGPGASDATGAFLTGKPVANQTVIIGATNDAGDTVTKSVELTVPPADLRPGLPPPVTGMMCPAGQRYYYAHQGDGFFYTLMQQVDSGNGSKSQQFVYDDNDGFYIKCYSSCNWMQTAMRVRRDKYDYWTLYHALSGVATEFLMQGTNDGQTFDPLHPWDGINPGEPQYPFPTPYDARDSAKLTPGPGSRPDLVWPLGVDYGVGTSEGFEDVSVAIKLYESGKYGLCTNGQRGVFYPGYFNCVDFSNTSCSSNQAQDWCPGRGLLDWNPEGQYAGTFSIEEAWTPTPTTGNDDQVYTGFAGAPTLGQMAEIKSLFNGKGILVETFPAVYHKVADNSRQLVKALDGRRSYMCDAVAWTSSRIIAEAPYLLNAVYCGGDISYGKYPAPRLALDPGVPATPRGAMDVDPDADSGQSCNATNPKG